jgi:PAS domain S-box-containing protein/diguanylate cyclase (GGDEF)-like protein
MLPHEPAGAGLESEQELPVPATDLTRIPALARRILHARLAILSTLAGGPPLFDAAPGAVWRRRAAAPPEETLCGLVLRSGTPLVVEDVRNHALVLEQPHLWRGEVAFASVPFRGPGGRVLGTLSLADGRPRAWSADEIELLAALSRYAGVLAAPAGARDAAALALAAASAGASGGIGLRMLRKAVETMQLGVTISDLQGRILYSNPADARMHGYEPGELEGRDARILAPPSPERPRGSGWLDGVRSWSRETLNVRRDGSVFPVFLRSDVVHDARGRPVALVTCCEDLTRRRELEQELLRNAFYDPVTALPNAGLLRHRLDLTVDLTRQRGSRFAVVAIELDRVQLVRDSLGAGAAEQVARAAADRLRECTPQEAMLAHVATAQFVVLIDPPRALEVATRTARCIRGMLREPFHAAGHEVFTGAAVGVVLCGAEYASADDVLRDAAIALLRAREAGSGEYQVFDPEMHATVMARLRLESDLRRAVERDEMLLHYQPIVELATGRISGFEALVRWDHPERGLVAPDEFIPMAEETGVILPLGMRVLEEACGSLRRWQRGPGGTGLRMAVNLSPRQLSQPDLARRIRRIVRDAAIAPRTLELEITESVFLEHSAGVVDLLHALRAMGIGVHVDDFGTGYSSLSALHRLPLDALKIDRSFLAGGEPNGLQIVRTIVAMAATLGVDVIGEGVESAEVLDELRALSCRFGQGFFLGHPVPADEAEAMLADAPRP